MVRKSGLFAFTLMVSFAVTKAEAKGGGKGSSPSRSSSGHVTKVKDKSSGVTRCYNEQYDLHSLLPVQLFTIQRQEG